MNTRSISAGFVLLAMAGAACSAEVNQLGPEGKASATASLTLPGARPVPVCSGGPCWTGSAVELIAADALAECAAQSDVGAADGELPIAGGSAESLHYENPAWDQYLYNLRSLMRAADCDGAQSQYKSDLSGWIAQRAHPACNVDPGGKAPLSMVLKPVAIWDAYGKGMEPICSSKPAGFLDPPSHEYHVALQAGVKAMEAIHMAAVNSCMAQKLRSVAPGSAGAEALLLSQSEQVELLEIARERAQLAMLQYGRLALAFQPSTMDCANEDPYHLVQKLGSWASANSAKLAPLGADFATAVELHAQTTQDLLELVHRSASARASTTALPGSIPERDWGAGSWRQRGLAVLFGGDALSGGPASSAPWKQTVQTTEPWPGRDRLAFVKTRVREPQVAELRELARECNAQTFAVDDIYFSSSCTTINVAGTQDLLYRGVEACLRTRDCAETFIGEDGQSHCKHFTAGDLEPTTQYESYRLWKTYRIRPEHSGTLAQVYAESLEPVCTNSTTGFPNPLSGMYAVDGYLDTAGIGLVHLDAAARLVPRPLAEVAPLFSEMRNFLMPVRLYPQAYSHDQGFPQSAAGFANALDQQEGQRLGGSASALAAIRDVVIAAVVEGSSEVRDSYLKNHPQILELIAGAIGPTHVSIRPSLEVDGYGDVVQSANPDGPKPSWYVDFVGPASDEFFQPVPASDTTWAVLAAHDDPWASSLVRHGGKIFGREAADVAQSARWSGPPEIVVVPGTNLARARFQINLPPSDKTWTFAIRKHVEPYAPPTPGEGGSGPVFSWLATDSYRLLAANVRLLSDAPGVRPVEHGHVIADGGQFGAKLNQMLARDVVDPASPAVDAFGLPTNWVPPTNPALLATKNTTSAAAYYLEKAKVSADDATAAVEGAFEKLIEEQKDEGSIVAATLKAQAIADEEKKSLCGDGNPECDLSVVSRKIDPEVLWPLPATSACTADWKLIKSCANLGGGAVQSCEQPTITDAAFTNAANCGAKAILQQAAMTSSIALAVESHLNESSPPAFSNFGGGSVQPILLRQWSAYRQLLQAGNELVLAVGAGQKKLEQANAAIADAEAVKKEACAIAATHGLAKITSQSTDYLADVTGIDVSTVSAFGISGSTATGGTKSDRDQKRLHCHQMMAQLNASKLAELTAAWEAMDAIESRAGTFLQKALELRLAESELAQATLRTKLAIARSKLDAELFAQSNGLKTQYGLYRRFHQYDMWRAKALLESARRHSVIARRAVEAQFLVDMSGMTADEALVARPSAWADSIYEYDLSMPAAVGLTAGKAEQGGIYASKLKDYVSNVDKFVQGFPISRPTAVAQADAEVLSIPGPAAARPKPKLDPADPPEPVDPRAFAWQFLCSGVWKTLPAPGEGELLDVCVTVDPACAGPDKPPSCGETVVSFVAAPPTRARVTFAIDPWGRVEGNIAQEPFVKRYNARWSKFAVNLVGTGVLDCKKAADPAGCYAQSFLRFDLSHTGPSWTTDYDQQWRVLPMPTARVEAGKALAAEEWLDPVSNGWGKPFVQAVGRSELEERPFEGTYTLELDLGPEARFDRIDRVQILLESSYWVKQQLAPARRSLPCVR